jgi:hypothetical protein
VVTQKPYAVYASTKFHLERVKKTISEGCYAHVRVSPKGGGDLWGRATGF